jgi:hypothetical protein
MAVAYVTRRIPLPRKQLVSAGTMGGTSHPIEAPNHHPHWILGDLQRVGLERNGLRRLPTALHGKPGAFPKFGAAVPHPVPFQLYDPFNFSKNRSEEAKARGLVMEINNGRLAMLGIFGFLLEQTIPGSIPLLGEIVKPYGGDLIAGKAFTFY